MDVYRFYVPDLPEQAALGPIIVLPEDQAHHARAVLRLQAGESLVLFAGEGAWGRAEVVTVAKAGVTARLTEPVLSDTPPALQLTLATAVPKGERAEQLIEQASQLNASTVQWIACDRGVVKPRERGQKMEKFRRLAIESAKQCHRTHLLQVIEPTTLEDILGTAIASHQRILWLDPDPAGQPVSHTLPLVSPPQHMTALIGPEGGWSDRESAILDAQAAAGQLVRVRLTPTVLRIETACAALAAILMSA